MSRKDHAHRAKLTVAGTSWCIGVMTFNVAWFGLYLSFPMFGEDGAANYSFLVEALRVGEQPGANFPVKWLEGLGQLNMFVTIAFDPFSWIMFSNLAAPDALRLSYALRATVCWMTTYVFIRSVLPGTRLVALFGAALCMLLCFTLVSFRGISTFAAPFVATQLAIFPGLLWLHGRVASARSWMSIWDVLLAAGVALFLLVHPLGSLLGLTVLFLYAIAMCVLARKCRRGAARRALLKVAVVSTVILFIPVVGLYYAWWAVAAVSARTVFGAELTTYSHNYMLPFLWDGVPLIVRLIVLLAISAVLLRKSWPRGLRVGALTAIAVIVVSQAGTLVRSNGLGLDFVDRLPRPFYLEFYLPVFYALAAAYVLARWPRLVWPCYRLRLVPVVHIRIDVGIVVVSWLAAYILRFYVVGPPLVSAIPRVADYLLILPLVVWMWVVGLKTYKALRLVGAATRDRWGIGTTSLVVGGVGAVGLLVMLPNFHLSRTVLLYFVVLSVGLLTAVAARVVCGAAVRVPTRLITSVLAFGGCAWAIVGLPTALTCVAGILLVEGVNQRCPRLDHRKLSRAIQATVRVAVALAVASGGAGLWAWWPYEIHPLFAGEFRCQERRRWWCADRPGRTMGADSNPISEFLRMRLVADGLFRGRAEFLIIPGAHLSEFPIHASSGVTREEFKAMHEWYRRAHSAFAALYPAPMFRWDPGVFTYEDRLELLWVMEALSKSTESTFGVLPDEVLMEIAEWSRRYAHRPEVALVSSFESKDEVAIMIQERNRNFLMTGNGMLLRALPLQGIPVASSYEQALDHLYYLFWTRYVNQGVPARRSINFTALETVWPERLGLIGVRYIIVRDVAFRSALRLPVAFRWRGYTVYELPNPNLAGWAPREVVVRGTISDELGVMRSPGFEPRRTAVIGEPDRGEMHSGQRLGRMRWSRVMITGQILTFEARAEGGAVLAVLPFKFSHCWRPRWRGSQGRVVRADNALIGVVFRKEVQLDLTWSAGYGSASRCLERDAELTRETAEAGAQLH